LWLDNIEYPGFERLSREIEKREQEFQEYLLPQHAINERLSQQLYLWFYTLFWPTYHNIVLFRIRPFYFQGIHWFRSAPTLYVISCSPHLLSSWRYWTIGGVWVVLYAWRIFMLERVSSSRLKLYFKFQHSFHKKLLNSAGIDWRVLGLAEAIAKHIAKTWWG
jgi:hypothetical protein